MLLCCGLFLWKLYSASRQAKLPLVRKYLSLHWFGLLLAAIVAGSLLARDTTGFKVLFDEHVLSSTARSMHTSQMAYVQTAGHVMDQQVIASIGNTDKRPLLFPFLLSAVHNITGYRIGNVFALNAALGFTLLSLLYGLISKFCSQRYGALGILLIGGLPLLAQNINGGGFEVLNLCLITGLILSAAHYFEHDDATGGLDLMILVSVL